MNLQQTGKRAVAQLHPMAVAVVSASTDNAVNSRRETDLPELDLVDGGCFERLHVAASTSGFAWFRSEEGARKCIQGWRDDDDHLFDDFYYFEALVADEDATSKDAITGLIEDSYADHIAKHKEQATAARVAKHPIYDLRSAEERSETWDSDVQARFTVAALTDIPKDGYFVIKTPVHIVEAMQKPVQWQATFSLGRNWKPGEDPLIYGYAHSLEYAVRSIETMVIAMEANARNRARANPRPPVIQCSSSSGTYYVAVVVKTDAQVRDLSAALQGAYDQGAAGFFNVWEIDAATKRIVFERQFGDDHEMLAGRVSSGAALAQAAAEQIAAEFAEISPDRACVAAVIAALRDAGCVVTSGLCDPAAAMTGQGASLQADPDGATVFYTELLAAWGALGAIGARHGIPTLTDLMSLQQAILKGETLEVWPGESQVLAVLEGLPSADRWVKYTDLPDEWKQHCDRHVASPLANA